MGHRLIEKDGKYKIYSTIANGYITRGWKTKEQILKHLNFEHLLEAKLKVIKEYMTFPFGWYNKEGKPYSNDDRKNFFEWQSQALDKDNYYEIVDEKYNEIMAELEKVKY